MEWSKDAEKLMSKVPFFVKKRVKKRVEEEAIRLGADIVSAEHVNSLKNRFLNKMEDDVKGYQVESCFGSGECPNSTINIRKLSEKIEDSLSSENIKGFLKEAVDNINGLISYYKENCVNGERFGELLENNQIFDLNQGGRLLNDILYIQK